MNKRKMKRWKQLIAAMLAITLLATSVDLQLLAAPAEATEMADNEMAGSDESLSNDGELDISDENEELAQDSLVLSEDEP